MKISTAKKLPGHSLSPVGPRELLAKRYEITEEPVREVKPESSNTGSVCDTEHDLGACDDTVRERSDERECDEVCNILEDCDTDNDRDRE